MTDRAERWRAVGAYVRTRLDHSGLTLVEYAKRSGVGEKTIAKFASGVEHSFRPSNITKLGRAMGVRPDWLSRLLDGLEPEIRQPDDDTDDSTLHELLLELGAELTTLREQYQALDRRLAALETPPPPTATAPERSARAPTRRAKVG